MIFKKCAASYSNLNLFFCLVLFCYTALKIASSIVFIYQAMCRTITSRKKQTAPKSSPEAVSFLGDPGHAHPQDEIELVTFPLLVAWPGNLLVLVIPARIELATYRLGGGCSILLSYGTI